MEKSGLSKQSISVLIDGKEVKTIIIPLANPIKSTIAFRRNINGFTVDM